MKRPDSRKLLITVIGALAFAMLTLGAATGYAALEDGRYSSLEKLGFAFYTLSGAKPNFMKWVTSKDAYITALPVRKQKIIGSEIPRLKTGMLTYDLQSDLIRIDSRIKVTASSNYAETIREQDGANIEIELLNLPENNFLPFLIGDVWVAVVLKDFEALTNLHLNQTEYQELAAKIGFEKYIKFTSLFADMSLLLRPISVDTSAPVMIDGVEMWLMLGEVAYIEAWRSTGSRKNYFWEYKAPWYATARESELRNLYWQD